VAVREGVVAGMLLGYVLPDPYDVRDLEEYPDVVRPLVALEALVAGSWYINALAVTDRCRGQGIGRRLMSLAEELAELAAAPTLSLIVADENRIAVRLYERLGYKPIAHRRPVPYPGSHVRGSWILMTKPTPSNREDAASDRS